MMNNNDFLPWSDNWHIEDNKAWCIDGERNILYCLDLKLDEFIFLEKIPEETIDLYRMNPHCIKYKDFILCMPDRGNNIWIYQLKESQFQPIKIHNPNRVRVSITDFWQVDEKIYAVSNGLKQVIEINIDDKRIDNYYSLCNIPDVDIVKSIMVGTVIYSVCTTKNEIYWFDIKTNNSSKYYIKDVEGGFRTICFDGQNFWLSGYRKEIYVWNREKNSVNVLNAFPLLFGIYNIQTLGKDFLDCETNVYDVPLFVQSVVLGQYIWFIPFYMNKVIYVDKDSFEIYEFEMEGEEESRTSLKTRRLKIKFIMEYVKQERYIGIFSAKNNCIIEIDALEKKYEKKVFSVGNTFIERMIREYEEHNRLVLVENYEVDRMLFKVLFNMDTKMTKAIYGVSVGCSIHQYVNEERI